MTGSRLSVFFTLITLITCSGYAQAFGFKDVADKARNLAGEAYQKPAQAPDFLRNLGYSDYQSIRFKPDQSLWRASGSRFQVMMIPQGSFYSNAVGLNVIDSEGVRPVEFDKTRFDYPSPELEKRVPADLGYAGFKLTYPLSGKDAQNQFLVFGGASYFRGVGANQTFGLSGRGIAVDTGLPSGEEFPAFTEFWMERPKAGADVMVAYGLLNGPSLTGAYRFEIHPGKSTRMDVTAQLFFREDIDQLGQAPLTSMFFYGENTLRPRGEWRPQVHDSKGLLVSDGVSGEWLWRPLVNPAKLQLSYLHVEGLEGFGLIQRDREFDDFQDSEARYDRRPSMWVKPLGEDDSGWGKGEVVLVEIPSGAESNDNIAAFFKPDQAAVAGASRNLKYSVTFGEPDITGQPNARAVRTFVGHGNANDDSGEALRLIVDFKGGELAGLRPGAAVVSQVSGAEGVEVIEHFVEYIEASDVWRLSILAEPTTGQPFRLRGLLNKDDKPVTETWTYFLGPETDLRGNPR
ncbi:glucan biosynthesis protein G [Marinobacter sp. 2_MG-2023]|uniref:glucan biosynthesis protein G n=1 Tax=Marinobacter sp. 2_MG-2023 TaxID=3062679 RepID=UPI0026E1B982|nr:glucan biosynthesis protein G [Marinobacter sp. 2_MG-2023]MDO6442551.1 glucan biosynthesis protein G [Marinobacter sp. 2_MG-2023]